MKRLVAGILAHVDAGKTTLAEALLYTAGMIRKVGRVDHKNAYLDTHEIERERGITIFSKQAEIEYKDCVLKLLDTPGHADFSAEAERTLSVLDYAFLVISASEGVQAHTETLWHLLKRYKIPTFVFVSKMDLATGDKSEIIADLTRCFGGGFVDFSRPEKDFEEIAMCGEDVFEKYGQRHC